MVFDAEVCAACVQLAAKIEPVDDSWPLGGRIHT